MHSFEKYCVRVGEKVLGSISSQNAQRETRAIKKTQNEEEYMCYEILTNTKYYIVFFFFFLTESLSKFGIFMISRQPFLPKNDFCGVEQPLITLSKTHKQS